MDATKQDTAPTVTFTEPTGSQAGNTFDVPIEFDQKVSGFTASDITVTTTRTSGTGDATVTLTGSDKDYTATVTSPTTAKGTIKLEVAKDAAYLQENPRFKNAKTATNNISFDTTVATVSFTEPTGTQLTTFDIDIDFSKSVTEFALGDIKSSESHDGTGNTSIALSGSGSDYKATVTLPADAKGTYSLGVSKDSVTDGTRTGPASEQWSSTVNFDTKVPTVSFTEPSGTQAANSFTVPITINKSVTGLTTDDITLTTTRTSGTGDATFTLSGSGTDYTATITSPTTAKGTVTLEVAKDAVTDGTRTGPASKATSNAIAFDTTVATVSFTEPAGTQVADSFTVPITFSKDVTGFATSDITVTTTRASGTGGATVALSGSGASYTATVTLPTAAQGTVKLEIAKNAVTDGTRTGPASKAASSTINFDTTVPTVTFTEPTGTQTGSTFDVGIDFSKSVTGFSISDDMDATIEYTGTGTLSFSLSGSGSSYTLQATVPNGMKGSVTLKVKADSVTDGTRTGPASEQWSSTVNFDTKVPTVSFTEPTGTQVDTFDVSITFSKDVTGFVFTDDITVTTNHDSGSGDAKVISLSGSGASYTAEVKLPTTASGTLTLSVDANAVTDGTRTGPIDISQSDEVAFDTRVPTVSFTEPTGTQVADSFTVPITFSKDVTGFATSDITVTTTRASGSGDATIALSGSGADYTATVTSPTTAKGTITLEVAKNAVTDGTRTGPASKATSSAINFDTTVATVSFNEPAGTQTANTFTVPITFSKSVTGFVKNDITLTSSTGTASFTLSGSGASYTATVTSPTAAKGTITLEVAKDAVTDGTRTGPASKATSDAINFDTTVATVSFNEPTDIQAGTTFTVPITFSKSVTGFTASDITPTTTFTSGSGTTSVSLTGSGKDYTASINIVVGPGPSVGFIKGSVTLEIAKNAVTDGTRTAPASKAISNAINFDTTPPTVSFNEPTGTQTASTFTVPITFSKSVTGFAKSDITVTTTRTSGSGNATIALSGSGASYTVTVTSPTTAKGTVTLEIAKNAVTDGTRTGPASKATSSAINFDTTVATVSFSEPAGTQIANSFTVPITFSKSVTGFTANTPLTIIKNGDLTVTTTRTSGSGMPR